MLSLSLTPKQQVIASKVLCKNFHAEGLACLLHLLLFLPTWTRSTGHVQKLWPTALPMITAATALFRSSSTTASLISRASRRRWFEPAAGRPPSFLAPHGGAIISGILGIDGQRGSLLPWGWRSMWTPSRWFAFFMDYLNYVATDALMYLRPLIPLGSRECYAPHGYRGLMAGSAPGVVETQYIRCCPFSLSARCKPGLTSYHHVLLQGGFLTSCGDDAAIHVPASVVAKT